MSKIESKILDFIKKHFLLIFLIIISVIAIFIRIKFLNFESNDYVKCLHVWFDYIKDHGRIHALANYPGDYNAPYMTILALLSYIPVKDIYLIKAVSIIFDFVLAISASRLVRTIKKEKNKVLEGFTYAVVLFLPNVLMNGALWAQCDSLYTAFVLIALTNLIKKKYTLSFIFLGVAFAFKLQFIFILPLFIIYYFMCDKKFSILNFLLIPITNIVLCIPAIIMGKPIAECMLVYYNQTQTYNDSLVMGLNNFYNLLEGTPDLFYKFGLGITIFICASALLYCIYKKVEFNVEKLLTLGLWFIVITTYVLPGMHERYLFMGEVLAVIIYIIYKKHLLLTLFINITAVISYSGCLFTNSNKYIYLLSLIYLFIIVNYTINTFNILINKDTKKIKNDCL